MSTILFLVAGDPGANDLATLERLGKQIHIANNYLKMLLVKSNWVSGPVASKAAQVVFILCLRQTQTSSKDINFTPTQDKMCTAVVLARPTCTILCVSGITCSVDFSWSMFKF